MMNHLQEMTEMNYYQVRKMMKMNKNLIMIFCFRKKKRKLIKL